MSEDDGSDVVRKKMLNLLEARKVDAGWSEKQPVDWRPVSVTHPDPNVNMAFTDKSCWYFIEQLLLDRHPIEVIALEKPPGEKGYVMLVETQPGSPDIYIKLQIGKDKLIGRSFHYSYRSK